MSSTVSRMRGTSTKWVFAVTLLSMILASLIVDMPVNAAVHEDSVGVVDQTQGQWYLRDHDTGATTSFYFGNPGDYPILGDWDCDGVETPGMYRQSDGYVYLRNSNTQGIANIRFFFGNPGDVPLAGDFNGNGCDTVSIYRPSEARFFIINKLGSNDGGLGSADTDFYFGNQGDKPFTGDFNNNGIDTVGLHRESTGFVYYRNTLTTGIAHNDFFFGDPGDQILTGRWAQNPGVGPETVGIFRPSNGRFYLRFSNTQGNADVDFPYGNAQMVAVSGNLGVLPGGSSPPPGPPPPPPVTFGAGTWVVGSEIPSGTYRNAGFSSGCYWTRLSGFSGEFGDIIANNFDDVGQIVSISPSDVGFSADSDCGTWSSDLSPLKAPTAQLGGGTWLVGSEVAPGTWRNTPSSTGCYWERLSGFSHESKDRITNDFIGDASQTIVTIHADDVGFYADADCGYWTYLGP